MFEDADVIHVYADSQAIEDGVLVDVTQLALPFGPGYGHKYPQISRCTIAIWHAYTEKGANKLPDMSKLLSIARMVMNPDNLVDGWFVFKLGDTTWWALPNELGSFTLMFPEDY